MSLLLQQLLTLNIASLHQLAAGGYFAVTGSCLLLLRLKEGGVGGLALLFSAFYFLLSLEFSLSSLLGSESVLHVCLGAFLCHHRSLALSDGTALGLLLGSLLSGEGFFLGCGLLSGPLALPLKLQLVGVSLFDVLTSKFLPKHLLNLLLLFDLDALESRLLLLNHSALGLHVAHGLGRALEVLVGGPLTCFVFGANLLVGA